MGTQTWNAKPHRNAFRQQNEREHEGGLGGGVKKEKEEQGRWEGGKNEPEKLLGFGGGQENQTTNQETQLCSSFGENASYK